jgi:hypothetical protein
MYLYLVYCNNNNKNDGCIAHLYQTSTMYAYVISTVLLYGHMDKQPVNKQ